MSIENLTSKNLINILETEMAADSILTENKQKNDKDITLTDVKEWYFEAEKILRVVSNITLNQAEHQVINQLRYAGHHIIKLSELSINDGSYHDNIVEAYKHCKRAYYDILDGYVLTLSDRFTNKINFIKDEDKRKELNKKINKLCISTVEPRFKFPSRQKYYSSIAENLIEGLRVLEEVNHLISEISVSENKTTLIKNNTILKNRINELESNLSNFERKQDSFISKLGIILAILLAISTAIAIPFQGYFTANKLNKHEINITHQQLTTDKQKKKSPIKTQEPDPKNDKTEKITND